MRQSVTLFELNSLVRETIAIAMPDSYWVEAELSEARESGGHCYMELIQKDLFTNTPIAKASAKCWKSTWSRVKPNFEQVTGHPLHAGMKVLLCVNAQFHENFGFSWIVSDIDPTFTLGDMARKRQEIIFLLKEQGVFELNKELILSPFTQRIAVISSQSAAGYGDFRKQLSENNYGFAFHIELFTAVMQGEQVEESVVSALNEIYERADDFDCVVIIRGGGSTSDLSGFDTLALAENVANFPLPVITGIGHDRDESILDMVAFQRMKTPTAAAAFLIDRLKQTSDRIEHAEKSIITIVQGRLKAEKQKIHHMAELIPHIFSVAKAQQEKHVESLYTRLYTAIRHRLSTEHHHIELLSGRMQPSIKQLLLGEKHRLDLLTQRTEAADPNLLLRRGYSITLKNGHTVRDPKQLHRGDEIETRLEKGTIKSIIS